MVEYFLEQAVEQNRLERRNLETKSILPQLSHVASVAPLGVAICCPPPPAPPTPPTGAAGGSMCSFFSVEQENIC